MPRILRQRYPQQRDPGEHYTWIKIAGAGVTLLGVALAQYAGQLQRLTRFGLKA